MNPQELNQNINPDFSEEEFDLEGYLNEPEENEELNNLTNIIEETKSKVENLESTVKTLEDTILYKGDYQMSMLNNFTDKVSTIQGKKGDAGPQGPTGKMGLKGEKGEKGASGATLTPEGMTNALNSYEGIDYTKLKNKVDEEGLVNKAVTRAASITAFNSLSDVDMTSVLTGQVPAWNATLGKWLPTTAGSGSSVWGGITGTLSSQTDLQAALNLKADTTALTAGLLLKEDLSNKQTNLTASATNYPTVNAVNTGLALKEATITATTIADYYRGDKTFQTLNGLAVTNTPAGTIAATTVQAAINELDTEKAIDTTVVHLTGAESITGIKTFTAQPSGITGTSIVNTPAGTISSTDVQSAINELATESEQITNKATNFTTLNNTLYPTTAAVDQLVSNALAGLTIKAPVRMATTANIALTGLQTLDTIVGAANDRVLVKNQTTIPDNGIYLMQAGAWTRTTDADTGTELVNASVYVSLGAVHATQSFVQSTAAPITIGVSNIVWNQSAAGSGSVTTVSVTTTNGFAGIVTNPTTTPAIAISTTVTGLLKGDGTAVSAAVAGTDFAAIGGSAGTPSSITLTNGTGLPLSTGVTGVLPAANGGTGIANNAAMTVTGSGNFAYTRTLTGVTNVTFPTTGTLSTLTGTETLTNKTLTSPIIGTIVNTGTLTLPTSTDTLVGRATTDTLTNKSISFGTNTLTGTKAQFDTACTDDNFEYSATASTISAIKTYSASVNGDVGFGRKITNNATATGAVTVNFATTADHTWTLTGNVTSVAFTAPQLTAGYVKRLSLRIIQDATGGRTVASWPASVKWPGGTAPTITSTASKTDIITFDYDGTNYWAVISQNF